ncbi:proline-, glutamic acid- and leucine-rich protein 1-like [Anneissia japonica]|uniref:proline-, glutamic acid- and leucine-rich protein 1-like n=1 Tax=Anneissia japonica TaxID=1529436 RepID=UPI0014257F3A|nr:proline-, glutamic acid- and leucine-rich protein 1-like [Anneissia japonica]
MDVHVGVTSTLFSAVLRRNSDDNTLPSVIRAVSELQILQTSSKNVEDWIGKVNTALNSRKTRLEALCLLRLITEQCSSEVFSQHCMSWLRILLLQVLQSHNSVKVLQVGCSVMMQILQQVSQFSEMSREVSTEVMPSLILCLLRDSKEWLVSAFQLLGACMRCFPGPCGQFKTKIEDMILPALSDRNPEISKAASQCYSLLAMIGGGGNAGIKHTEAWTHYFDRLLVSAHSVLASLYDGLETESYFLPSLEGIRHSDVSDIEPSRTFHLAHHFDVLCSCICNMLQWPYDFVARVPLPEVISLCCRCFTVQPYMLSTEHSVLLANLFVLQRAALDILSALITSCRSNLIPEGHTINQLLLQSLQSTNSEAKHSQKPYSILRTQLYTVLEKWITALGTATGVEGHVEKLVDLIIQDCTPPVNPVGSLVIGQGFSNQQVNLLTNSEICEAALKVLRILLLSCQLSPAQHKVIQEFAVSQLLKIHQHNRDLPVPYNSHNCRKELYHVLLAQILTPHPRWPPSLHCAVQLFRFGRQDSSSQVAGFCTEASITCVAIMHPKVPSLHSRLPKFQDVEKQPEKRLEISSSSVVDLQQNNMENEIVRGNTSCDERKQIQTDVQKRSWTDVPEVTETVNKRTKHGEEQQIVDGDIEKNTSVSFMTKKMEIVDNNDCKKDSHSEDEANKSKEIVTLLDSVKDQNEINNDDKANDSEKLETSLSCIGNQISQQQIEQPSESPVHGKYKKKVESEDEEEMLVDFVDKPASDT